MPEITTTSWGTVQEFKKYFNEDEGYYSLLLDPFALMSYLSQPLQYLITSVIKELRCPCKVQICLTILFDKGEDTCVTGFWSSYEEVYTAVDVPEFLTRATQKINDSLEAYSEKGSGWVINLISSITVKMSKYNPMQAS